MKKVSRNKKWDIGTVKVHVEPHPITIIKSKNYGSLDKYFIN